jgi:hypothetical protein
MNIYAVQKWKNILMFFYVKTIIQSTIFNNIFSLVLKCMINFRGLGLEELGKKLVNGCDSSSVFQNNRTSVLCNLKKLLHIFTMPKMSFYD